ncbi:hypothetical protein SDC9_160191 [bioreactor metagenome]|uniref:OmpA-like domain-containing protein n=1 Tax=bioreactor metagenome TaxID=1076179 RepID=A0A645FER6_9ZZZZ
MKIEKRESIKREITSKSYNDINEENQKVEIFTKDLDLFTPIALSEIEKTANPPQVFIEVKASSDVNLDNYSLNLEQSGTTIRKYQDNLNSNQLNDKKTWNILEEPVPILDKPVTVTLNAKDKQNNTKTVTNNVEIIQKTIKSKRALIVNDMKIERYSLVLFDLDKYDATQQHKKVLNEIKKSVQPNSTLYILGYADRTGEEQYNINLAKNRCSAINDYINPGNKVSANQDAIGSTKLIYDNNTPEGRAFSRTVRIEIRTPVK